MILPPLTISKGRFCFLVVLFALAAPFPVRGGVALESLQLSVHSDACTEDNTCDPQSGENSTGQQMSVVSNVFVAMGRADTGFASIQLPNGLRMEGNMRGEAGASNVSGRTALGNGTLQCTFIVSGTTHTWTISGQLTAQSFDGMNTATFRILSLPSGTSVFERTVSGVASQPLGGGGKLIPGTYRIELQWNATVQANQSAVTTGFFTVDVTTEDNPTPTPAPTPTPSCEGPQCEDFHWTNPSGGNFSEPNNWNRMAVPGANDTAIFDLAGPNVVAVQANNNLVDGVEINNQMAIGMSGLLQSAGLEIRNKSLLDLQPSAILTVTGSTIVNGSTLTVAGVGTRLNGRFMQIIDGGIVDVDQNAVLSAENTVQGIELGDSQSLSSLTVTNAGLVQTPFFTIIDGAVRIRTGGSVLVDDSCKVFHGFIEVQGEGASNSRLEIGGTLDLGGRSEPAEVVTGLVDLRIFGGATVRAEDVILGDRNLKFADTVTVSGVGASGQASSLILGDRLLVEGVGGTQVEVEGGALLSASTSVRIGLVGRTGKIFVRGETGLQSSTLTASEVLIGSQVLPSELIVQDGGRVTIADRLLLGPNAAEVGRVIISGSTSSLAAGDLFVGADGDGELTLSDGARVTSTSAIVGNLLIKGTGTGLATIAGTLLSSSEWHVTGDCEVGAGEPGTVKLMGTTVGPFSVGGATLRVDGTLTVQIAGAILGNGTLMAGSRVVNGGFISPGLSPGVIAIEGDYEQTSTGKLKMQVGGLSAEQFDGVHVTGDAILGGKLEMTFLNGYLPGNGDTFRFLEVDGSITGQFAEVVFPQLLPGFQFDVAVVPGGLQFTALSDAVLKPRPLNISTRMRVETGDNVLIGGFILTGNDSKKVILRAIGPSLAAAGLPGFLEDPTLDLYDSSGALMASNDNWRTGGQEAEIIASNVPPTNDLESAIVRTLPVGAYTAIVRGNNSGSGVGLVEAYDLDGNVDSQLANISTRGLVQTADNVMIGGFIVGGGGGTAKVIVRAIGPSLPLPGTLQDPLLELHDGNGTTLASNDNWRSDQEAEIIASSIPPTNDFESAIVRTLTPGPYTAIVHGVNATTGVAVVEVYTLN